VHVLLSFRRSRCDSAIAFASEYLVRLLIFVCVVVVALDDTLNIITVFVIALECVIVYYGHAYDFWMCS
jgi:hypothetical protein